MNQHPPGPCWLDPTDPTAPFPPVDWALDEPNGLLAAGGDLQPQRLLNAYAQGIFPWFSEGQPILWWSPDPRLVLYPQQLHVPRSLKKTLNKRPFRLSLDSAFGRVMDGCAAPRPDQDGTWITPGMRAAYLQLHELGYAHSVEAWLDEELVGGLYGVALGRAFFGESMFTRRPDASKIAFVSLVHQLQRWDYRLIDCQVYTGHLARFGAEEIPRQRFIEELKQAVQGHKHRAHAWQFDPAHGGES